MKVKAYVYNIGKKLNRAIQKYHQPQIDLSEFLYAVWNPRW